MLNKLGITDYSAKVRHWADRSALPRSGAVIDGGSVDSDDDEPSGQCDGGLAGRVPEKFRGALLMITHDRYFLDNVTDHIVELDKEAVQLSVGYEGYLV